MGCSSKAPAALFQSQEDKQMECSESKVSSMFINVSCSLSMLGSAQEKQCLLPTSKGWSRRLPRPFYDGGRKVTEWECEFGERSSKECHKC